MNRKREINYIFFHDTLIIFPIVVKKHVEKWKFRDWFAVLVVIMVKEIQMYIMNQMSSSLSQQLRNMLLFVSQNWRSWLEVLIGYCVFLR